MTVNLRKILVHHGFGDGRSQEGHGIRIRDQVRFPTAPDVKAMMAENYAEGGTYFQLVFGVSKAHRRVPVLEGEWGRQACQITGSAAATAQARRCRSVGPQGGTPVAPEPLAR